MKNQNSIDLFLVYVVEHDSPWNDDDGVTNLVFVCDTWDIAIESIKQYAHDDKIALFDEHLTSLKEYGDTGHLHNGDTKYIYIKKTKMNTVIV